MDLWDDLISELWPEGADEEGAAITYLRDRLNPDLLDKATALRLASDLGAECVASLQADWEWHHRFTYALLAPFIFNPGDPAQWFVDLGLNRYPEKARDVLNNIAIVERRQTAIASLLPKRSDIPVDVNEAALEWIKVQAYPAWAVVRWTMQIAVGLEQSDNIMKTHNLLPQLPEEHMNLMTRYVTALELIVAASKQAALEAIDRPV